MTKQMILLLAPLAISTGFCAEPGPYFRCPNVGALKHSTVVIDSQDKYLWSGLSDKSAQGLLGGTSTVGMIAYSGFSKSDIAESKFVGIAAVPSPNGVGWQLICSYGGTDGDVTVISPVLSAIDQQPSCEYSSTQPMPDFIYYQSNPVYKTRAAIRETVLCPAKNDSKTGLNAIAFNPYLKKLNQEG